jgi:hypothetical protein
MENNKEIVFLIYKYQENPNDLNSSIIAKN